MKEPTLLETIPDLSTRKGHTIPTQLESHEGATYLQIFYSGGCTYVVPCGEVQNAEPWGYRGIHDGTTVVAWYLISVLRHDELDVDPKDL
jgi:hypothetical protein